MAAGDAGDAMEMGEAMIVAGIGCRKDVRTEEVLAAIDAALAEHGLDRPALGALATAPLKREEAAIRMAGAFLSLDVVIAEEDALKASDGRTLSRSAPSLAAADVLSVSEAAALAVAGEGSVLLGPRLVLGPVTCAIARSEDGR
jgi:cobalt-precorrin 5A hydrolase